LAVLPNFLVTLAACQLHEMNAGASGQDRAPCELRATLHRKFEARPKVHLAVARIWARGMVASHPVHIQTVVDRVSGAGKDLRTHRNLDPTLRLKLRAESNQVIDDEPSTAILGLFLQSVLGEHDGVLHKPLVDGGIHAGADRPRIGDNRFATLLQALKQRLAHSSLTVSPGAVCAGSSEQRAKQTKASESHQRYRKQEKGLRFH